MPNEISTTRRSLAPTTYSEAFEFAQHLAKSSMVPTEYRGKPENILLAIQWGMEVGLAPLQAIQNIAVINGKPSVYGDALLAMVKGSPVCDDVIERFEGSGDDLAAVCEAKRAGKAPVVSRFSIKDAKAAHLWGKTGPWTQYPRRMLQMRARGFALRDAFPDVLRGVITREEAEDYPIDVSKPREPIDVTPKRDLDAFAKGGDVVDAETGEITDPVDEALVADAMSAAKGGTPAFKKFYAALTERDKAAVKGRPEHWLGIAEEADRARQSEDESFRRDFLDEQAPADDRLERSPAGPPSDVARASPAGERTPSDPRPWAERLAALAPQPTDLAGDELDWPGYATAVIALIGEASEVDLAQPITTTGHMSKLRTSDGDSFARVREAIAARLAALRGGRAA